VEDGQSNAAEEAELVSWLERADGERERGREKKKNSTEERRVKSESQLMSRKE